MHTWLRRLAGLLLLLPLPGVASESRDVSGLFDLGYGHAERGDGSRASLALGFELPGGFGLYASRQKLSELVVHSTTITVGGGGTVIDQQDEPSELASKALYASYRWNLGATDRWQLRALLGVHWWRFDVRFADREFGSSRFSDSNRELAARVELVYRLGDQWALGTALESFRIHSRSIDRSSLFLRYRFNLF